MAMKQRLLDIIACPNDGHFPLELKIDAAEEDEIVTGSLYCRSCGTTFRIAEGIPRLLAERSFTDDDPGRDKAGEMRARDEQAPFYDRFMRWRPSGFVEKPLMLKLLAAEAKDLVVDLGAGTGRLSDPLAGLISELVAVDFSLESLRQSRAKGRKNIHWVQADLNYLPFREGIADRVLSSQVFEHLPGAAWRDKAIDEAARILKDGGTFAISVYRYSWLKRRSGDKEGYHYGHIYYCRLTAAELTELLERRFHIEQFIPNLGFYLQAAKCIKKEGLRLGTGGRAGRLQVETER